jgi:hypothetical protein
MSTAAQLDLVVDQGADWATQIYWTTGENIAYTVLAPMRMEVRDDYGGVPVVLYTNDTSEDETADPDNQSILFNSESGLIQLQMRAAQTNLLGPGHYSYDLFVSYKDLTTGFVRLRRLLAGSVIVNRRVTQNV